MQGGGDCQFGGHRSIDARPQIAQTAYCGRYTSRPQKPATLACRRFLAVDHAKEPAEYPGKLGNILRLASLAAAAASLGAAFVTRKAPSDADLQFCGLPAGDGGTRAPAPWPRPVKRDGGGAASSPRSRANAEAPAARNGDDTGPSVVLPRERDIGRWPGACVAAMKAENFAFESEVLKLSCTSMLWISVRPKASYPRVKLDSRALGDAVGSSSASMRKAVARWAGKPEPLKAWEPAASDAGPRTTPPMTQRFDERDFCIDRLVAGGDCAAASAGGSAGAVGAKFKLGVCLHVFGVASPMSDNDANNDSKVSPAASAPSRGVGAFAEAGRDFAFVVSDSSRESNISSSDSLYSF
mmetsp:Transcript_39658/g.114742  ORF Transcript_39658/g.114742 Transcript_39658/m.114742 type:complete len:354 (-) Transcript_39658:1021-2082(-)